MVEVKIVAKRLEELRNVTGYDRKEFADFLKINNKTYENWESGLREPSKEKLIHIARKTNVPLDYLIGEDLVERKTHRTKISSIFGNAKKREFSKKPVRIYHHHYERLLKEADNEKDRVYAVLGRVLNTHYEQVDNDRQNYLRAMEKNEVLEESFKDLTELFENAKSNGSVCISLTNEGVGHEGSGDLYKLVKYDISFRHKYFLLELEQGNRIWPISFDKIDQIEITNLYNQENESFKIHIHFRDTSWRMFINYKTNNYQL